MRIGFACSWSRPAEATWSHTPWQLRAALRERAGPQNEVVDLDLTVPWPVEQALRLICARRHDGRWVSMWRHCRAARWLTEQLLLRKVRSQDVDVVLEIFDLGIIPDVPFYVLQDLSFDTLLELAGTGHGVPHFPSLSPRAMRRLRDRQRTILAAAHGVVSMSAWQAGKLVSLSAAPATKVHVVHPGANAIRPPGAQSDQARSRRPRQERTRLLSVGKDFPTKGGAQILAALHMLRREDPRITLTVAGPGRWPFDQPVPEGVDFRGRVSLREVVELYDSHDLFVLPSTVEGFGIVFAEALSRGLPCIARDAFAMPEIVRPGVGGYLVRGSSPEELASTITTALNDDMLYERCAADAPRVTAHFTWARAADQVLSVLQAGQPPHREDAPVLSLRPD